MSESDGEQAARSLALEQAYVHEVYEQCAERSVQAKHWPRINQFLEELEPGALVCDIGCGNGKYLDVNRNIFNIGVDRCSRFTSMARENGNEVLTCDNLALPFRDESFDAVLSIAVVHHFSTTERRVRALKELARVLRIGGRIVISVWAMEQKHRKFESQDVLVPWPKAYCISSTGSPVRARGMSYDERHRGGGKYAQTTYLLSKSASQRNGSGGGSSGKNGKSYWIDPIFSPSPSTSSSLSSPNETCYSFFRRALQKLAGGRRNSRAWFLENWQQSQRHRHYDDEDDGDVDDLPIELRRLEDHQSSGGQLGKDKRATSHQSSTSSSATDESRRRRQILQQQHSAESSIGSSTKSKSLGSIHEAHGRTGIVRSRSSIPGLCGAGGSLDEQLQQQATSVGGSSNAQSKPKLVHQKTHYRGDEGCDGLEPGLYDDTAIHQLLKGLPELQEQQQQTTLKRGNVHKQSSMNEELMSIERLKERESVRRNIMKQASLNEELIYKSKPTLEALRDSFYSASASKRFQLIKSGLTNRIRQSTTNIEKVSGMSLKNGFVRILQSWTSTESPAASTTTTTSTSSSGCTAEQLRAQQQAQNNNNNSNNCQPTKQEVERRLSREDGSDSSKDSSLQSDTSVDSEDSFASVIFVPKKQSTSPLLAEVVIGPPPAAAYQLNTTSAPPSPRVKYAPELLVGAGTHRMKLISMSPLLKQFPATSKSLPPPSPPGLSPRTLNSATMRPFFSGNEIGAQAQSDAVSLVERIAEVKRSFDSLPALPRMPSADSGHGSNGVASATHSQADLPEETVAEPSPIPHLGSLDPMLRRLSLQQLHQVKSVKPKRDSNGDSDSDADSDSDDSDSDSDEPVDPDFIEEETSPLITDAIDEALEELSEKSLSSSDSASTNNTTTTSVASVTSSEEEDSRRTRLDQIKELLKQKPGFASRASRAAGGAFPIVRRASTATGSRLETVTKVLPRLLSLELFNPETDDLDSDSSGVSSPESVGSVISVISDERYIAKKDEPSSVTADPGKEKSSEQTDPVISPDLAVTQKRPSALDTHISPVESTWSEECSRHLNDYTDRLKGTLIRDIDQFCRMTKLHMADDHLGSSRYTKQTTDNNTQANQQQQLDEESNQSAKVIERSCSEESSDAGFVVVSSSGEFLSESELRQQQKLSSAARTKTPSIGQQQQQQQRYPTGNNNSIESSDIGDSISESMESSSFATRRFCSGSTASLATSSSLTADQARARLGAQARSASEEIPSRGGLVRQQQLGSRRSGATSASNGTLSGSSSQESLPSDQITYHQYYHVFREGELDQLIDKYVENLHIISSYYDHASWCVVAEKVQVWTI